MTDEECGARIHYFRLVRVVGFASLLALSAGCNRNQEASGHAGKRVMYATTSRVRGFDPVRATDVASALAVSKIYEGLLQYSYLSRPYRIEPNLAECLPQMSEDGLTYTFRIRENIFFQDNHCFTNRGGKGRQLTADDFVYSIKRVMDLKCQSSGCWAFNDRIVGLDEFRAASSGDKPTDYERDIQGLTALGAHTLQIKLKRPYPQLLWILTMPYAFAVPREAVEYYGKDFVNNPVGTGPFVLKSWKRNCRLEFVRNPKWLETGRVERYPCVNGQGSGKAIPPAAGRPIPFLNRIVQSVVDDASTQWLMFLLGEFDASGVSRENWDAVIMADRVLTEGLQKKKIRLYSSPALTTYYIGFNMDDPVLGKNRKLRQALTCAFDTGQWIKFWKGRVIRATGPIPPGIAGNRAEPSPYAFDLAKAGKLLSAAGYPEGKDVATGRRLKLTLELGSASSAEMRESTELLIAFIREIGVEIKPSYNTWPTFLQKLERRQCQMFRLCWVADYPDAENFLQLFYAPSSSPGPNRSNYVNTEFDHLYEQVRVMPDSSERTEIYRRMADIVIEDCPWIFMHHPLAAGLYHHWLENIKPHDFAYGMEKYYRTDSKKRREWKNKFGNSRTSG